MHRYPSFSPSNLRFVGSPKKILSSPLGVRGARGVILKKMNPFFRIPNKIDKVLASGIIGIIKFYQKTISPDHSEHGKCKPFSGCKFYPSCSEYAILTLRKKGATLGLPQIIWRILRCNPWNKGGIDMP